MTKRKNRYGIAGLVLGTISIFSSLILAPVGVVCGILGVIFTKKQKRIHPNGIATAGFIISIIGLIQSIIFSIFFIFAIISFINL